MSLLDDSWTPRLFLDAFALLWIPLSSFEIPSHSFGFVLDSFWTLFGLISHSVWILLQQVRVQ